MHRADGHSLTFDEAAAIADALGQALTFAHSNGVLHLDIKPANVLIEHSGNVKLSDFGIARLSSAGGFGGSSVGTIGYMNYDMDNASVEIGYSLAKWMWNGGYMTEALRRVIDYTFDAMDINRIEAQHELDNPASGRVMEKCGMRREGVLRQRLYNMGKFGDVALSAILKHHARPARRAPAR